MPAGTDPGEHAGQRHRRFGRVLAPQRMERTVPGQGGQCGEVAGVHVLPRDAMVYAVEDEHDDARDVIGVGGRRWLPDGHAATYGLSEHPEVESGDGQEDEGIEERSSHPARVPAPQ